MSDASFITVVPAIRTVPGVEEFDYAIHADAGVHPGDVIRVPFRKRDVLGLVIRVSPKSPIAEKAIKLESPDVLFRFGDAVVHLLLDAAVQSFSSKPTIFLSWIRQFPKRKLKEIPTVNVSKQTELPVRENRFFLDRWHDVHGLVQEAKLRSGKTLVITPWQHRADALAVELGTDAIHSDVTPGASWRAIKRFAESSNATLVTTRVGAWLSCIADTVLLDEPENDDLKSDELQPRLDARWIVLRCAERRSTLSFISFSTTPRLRSPLRRDDTIPTIAIPLTKETWKKRSGSAVECLSPQSVRFIEEAIENAENVTIIHPIRGDRARLACRDCGWTAVCAFCAFHLSHVGSTTICKRCGRKGSMPDACKNCGGVDLSRGQPGKDRLAEQCAAYFRSDKVRVLDPMEFDATVSRSDKSLIIITDLSLIAGVAEDIRRKERLIIAWRRIAAAASTTGARIHVQGSEELIDECGSWLTNEGVNAAWKTELADRAAFGYPPSVRLAKLLVDGEIAKAETLRDELSAAVAADWNVRGPFPVTFRSYTRTPRHVLQLVAPTGTTDDALVATLAPYKNRVLIDLDPIAFFS